MVKRKIINTIKKTKEAKKMAEWTFAKRSELR
jgi:hypothetical protein